MTSGAGGWRIAIIDTADDMNDAAANALLKALEEPPSRAMLMLLSNAPGRLLPTIRSRCQRLNLRPLNESGITAELAIHVPKMSEKDRAVIARLSGGSIGAALALANDEGLALARDAEAAVGRAANPDIVALLNLGDRIARKQDALESFGEFLVQALTERIRTRAKSGGGANLRRWLGALEKVRQNFIDAEKLHLEPRQTIVSSARALSAAARRNAL